MPYVRSEVGFLFVLGCVVFFFLVPELIMDLVFATYIVCAR